MSIQMGVMGMESVMSCKKCIKFEVTSLLERGCGLLFISCSGFWEGRLALEV